jgi:phenylacetate-CoA ligase
MEKLRSKKLRAILRYAYNNVPFYHRKFDEAHVKPDDIKSALDLWKIPPTTKNEIQRTPPLDLVSNDFDLRRCRKDSTSGSSGMPLTTYMSKEAFDFYSMVWTAMFLENGVRPWDKEAIIGDPRTFPERRSLPEFFGIMPKKYISIFADEQKQLEHLKVYRPDIIDGFPSSLSIIANEHNRRKEGLMPRLIFTHAETLDRHTRRFLIKSFEADLLDYYGSSELSLIAWECSEHMGYHINSDCMVVEFLRNGDSIGAAESGEITCTSLVNYVMPLIRYRQGDIAVPLGEPCRCGKTLPMLKAIEGRADDFLVTLDGRVISPSIFFPYPFKSYGNIKQFKVIQERKDLLKIQLLTDGALGEKILEEAKEDIWKVFGKGMQVEFELLDEFKRASSGKIKKIESRIQIKFE